MHSPTVLKSQVSLTRYVTFSTCLASLNLSVLACEMGPRPISARCSEEGAVHTTLTQCEPGQYSTGPDSAAFAANTLGDLELDPLSPHV